MVVEADPSGGVLGARYGWGVEPGLVSLIAGLRRSEGRAVGVEEHARRLAGGVWVVPAPESGERARSVLTASNAEMAARFADDSRIWVVDAGRLEDGNPSLGLVDRSAVTVLVCGGRPEDVVQVPSRVERLRRCGGEVGLLVVGRCPYRREELAEFTGVTHVWLAWSGGDLREATAAVVGGSRRARRILVWRQAVEVAADVASVALRCYADELETRLVGGGS